MQVKSNHTNYFIKKNKQTPLKATNPINVSFGDDKKRKNPNKLPIFMLSMALVGFAIGAPLETKAQNNDKNKLELNAAKIKEILKTNFFKLAEIDTNIEEQSVTIKGTTKDNNISANIKMYQNGNVTGNIDGKKVKANIETNGQNETIFKGIIGDEKVNIKVDTENNIYKFDEDTKKYKPIEKGNMTPLLTVATIFMAIAAGVIIYNAFSGNDKTGEKGSKENKAKSIEPKPTNEPNDDVTGNEYNESYY